MLFSAREHLASHWLDLAEGRLRLDRLNRNGGGETFFPWDYHPTRKCAWGPRFAHSSRGPRKSPRRHPPLRSGPRGAASIAFGFQIAIEAAVVAGSKTARRRDTANIGSFKKSGQEFQGEIVTLSLQTKGVRIVPETDRTNDNAPSHHLTYPGEDTESHYHEEEDWEDYGNLLRWLLIVNQTFLGRFFIGPLLRTPHFFVKEARKMVAGDAADLGIWVRHFIAVALILLLVAEISKCLLCVTLRSSYTPALSWA
jgi:hypothetical protein